MTSPEQPNSHPQAPASLTPEQMILMQQGFDPIMGQDALAVSAISAEAVYPSTPERPLDARANAVEQLATVERAAINALPQTGTADALSVTEQVQKDRLVSDVRKNLESIFGEAAATEAHETAIEHSKLQTQEAGAIATAIEAGKHELPSSNATIDPLARGVDNASRTTTQFNKLKDKIDGRAGTVLNTVAERTNHRLGKFGIRMKKKDLAAEAVEADGEHLAEDSVSVETQRQLAGEAVAGALIDNKPGMSGARRKALLESLANDPAARKQVLAAARSYRDGVRNLRSFTKAGKALERLQ